MQKENFSVGNLRLGEAKHGAVTQASNRTTAVTLNTLSGTITTNATSLAAAGEATFVVNNSYVNANSTVVLTQRTPSATGTSLFFVSKVTAGTFEITLTNLHATTADTSASVVNFVVINGN
jgi:hypothetical protein